MQSLTAADRQPFLTRYYRLIVIIITIFTFALRVAQISQGLPDVQIVDENSDLSLTARLLSGQYPTDIHFHRLAILLIEVPAFGIVYLFNVVRTGHTSMDSFRDLFFSNRGDFVLASRFLIVVVSAFAVLALADLMRRATSPTGGIIAALLGSVYYYWHLNLLYAMPDSLILSSIVFFLWAVFLVLQTGTKFSYAASGAFLALIFMCKISATPIGIALALAHLFRVNSEGEGSSLWRHIFWDNRIVIALAGFVIGCVVVNPLAFIHPQDSLHELGYIYTFGYGGYGETTSPTGNLSIIANGVYRKSVELFQTYVGLALTLSLALAFVAIVVQRQKFGAVMIAAFIGVWLTNAVSTHYARASYWLPLVPILICLAAFGYVAILTWGQRYGRAVHIITVLAVIGAILNEAYFTTKAVLVAANESTLQQAQDYIYQHWQKSASILMGDNIVYSVPIHRTPTSILRARSLGAPALQADSWWMSQPDNVRQHEYNIYGPEYQSKITTYDGLHQLIISQHIQYVITSDTCTGTTSRPDATSALEFPAIDNDAIMQDLKLVATFSPFEPGYTCPVSIWERIGPLAHDTLFYFQRPGPVVKLYRSVISLQNNDVISYP